MSVACLRILQAALVYVNTLLLQDVLAEPERADLLTDHDRRGLTPLCSGSVEHGVFFDQVCADGPGREEGSRACSTIWATTSSPE